MTITHSEMVASCVKNGEKIKAEMTGDDVHLLHMVVGISGEAGELLDAIKKQVIYRKPLDLENVIEELGDLEFYMEGVRQVLGFTREQCLEANIAKLSKRYDGLKYSDAAAQNRADKVEVGANGHQPAPLDDDFNEPLPERQTTCEGDTCESCQ
jgi:NTP pyrophosphatase (non-canonical NTP hydrolase)